MTTIILSDSRKNGGINTWIEMHSNNISIITVYSLEELKKILTSENKKKLFVNNYTNLDFYNKEVLTNIQLYFNIYFIIHSNLCPTNKLFVSYIDYFTGTVCTCYSAYEKVKRLYPNMEIIYMPNTISNSTLSVQIKKQNKSPLRCHYVGRLSLEKNIPMLLEAMIQLSLHNIILYIYGDNNNQHGKYLMELVKYFNIQNSVFFMGHSNSKNELYNLADIIILPSVHEGLPYCLLEAKMFNVPIISHNSSNIDYHIPNEIYYQYDNININDFSNELYINDYNCLLKRIGYCELIITPKIMTAQKIMHDMLILLCTKDNKILIGKKIMVPPFICGIKNKIYSNNVNKIVNNLLIFQSNM